MHIFCSYPWVSLGLRIDVIYALIGLSIDIAIGDQISASSQLIDRSHDMLTGFVLYNCSLYLAISQVIFTVFEVCSLLCRCLIYIVENNTGEVTYMLCKTNVLHISSQ